jgi:hypothetical protein
MPLQDYISADEDERQGQVAEFLQERWHDVLDEDPVSDLQASLESRSWFAKSFNVGDSEVGEPIKARFSFVVEGLDDANRSTGEVIIGSAVAEIDEFDNVVFTDVEAEQKS